MGAVYELERVNGWTSNTLEQLRREVLIARRVTHLNVARRRRATTPTSAGPKPCSDDLLLTVRFVRTARAGVGPLVAPWRRSGLTRAEGALWEGAIRTVARSLNIL